MSYPFNIRTIARVQATGLNGALLSTGDIITGESNLRAISVTNGLVKVTYERPDALLSEYPACHLYLLRDGEWLRCVTEQYGDWSFFVNPISATCDRAVVVEATDEAVEISFEWTAHDLDTGYLSTPGLNERNPSGALNYFDGSPTPHRITESYTRKVVRIQRGIRGYWLAWRSKPEMTPEITAHSQGLNNDKDHAGEREFGTGNGSAVAWASTGKIAYFPAWRSQRDWSAVTTALPTFDNFAWWPGIDDPPYSPWSHATVIAMQPAGYPAHQTTGPWYIADIPVSNYGGNANICRYLVMKNPHESGSWCYAGQSGTVLTHLANNWIESDGRRTRFSCFLGAEYHVPDATAVAKSGYTGNVDFGNEPSATIQATIAARVATVVGAWPT